MKQQRMQDERIGAQRRKVNSEAYGILMIVLLASILVQQFWLGAPVAQYAVEAICFFGMAIYIVLRYMMLGLNLYGEGRRAKGALLLNSIVAGVVVTAINGVLHYSTYAARYQADGLGYFIAVLAVTFLTATLSAFLVLWCVDSLNQKRQEKIQKQLDEKEQAD